MSDESSLSSCRQVEVDIPAKSTLLARNDSNFSEFFFRVEKEVVRKPSSFPTNQKLTLDVPDKDFDETILRRKS